MLSVPKTFQRDYLKLFLLKFENPVKLYDESRSIAWSAKDNFRTKTGDWTILRIMSRGNNFPENKMESLYPQEMYNIGGKAEFHVEMMRQIYNTYKTLYDEVKTVLKTRPIDQLLKEGAFHFDKKRNIERNILYMIQECYSDPNIRFSGGKRSKSFHTIYENASDHTNISSPLYFCKFEKKYIPNNIIHMYWDNILTKNQFTYNSNMKGIEVIFNPHAQYIITNDEDKYNTCDDVLYLSLIEEIYSYLIEMETDYWFKENIHSWVNSLEN